MTNLLNDAYNRLNSEWRQFENEMTLNRLTWSDLKRIEFDSVYWASIQADINDYLYEVREILQEISSVEAAMR